MAWLILVSGLLRWLSDRESIANQETQFWSLGWEELLEKEMTTHSSILAWETPWTGEPGGLYSMGSQRVRQDSGTKQQQQTSLVSTCQKKKGVRGEGKKESETKINLWFLHSTNFHWEPTLCQTPLWQWRNRKVTESGGHKSNSSDSLWGPLSS